MSWGGVKFPPKPQPSFNISVLNDNTGWEAGDIPTPNLNLSKMNMIEVSFNSPPHYEALDSS